MPAYISISESEWTVMKIIWSEIIQVSFFLALCGQGALFDKPGEVGLDGCGTPARVLQAAQDILP